MVEEGGENYLGAGTGEPIDIILPTHGKLDELTIPCVHTLYAHTRSPFHLIIVDDSTPDMDDGKDRTPQWAKRLQIEQTNVTYIHSHIPYKSGNQVFNVGLAHTKHRFVATVMNSILVEPNWEIVPIQMLMQNPKIGIIGIKCLKLGWNEHEDGQIECAGIAMNGFTPIDLGRDQPGHRLACSYPCFSLQWAFALLRKEAVVGNLDENLWQGFVGFDDIDNTIYLRYKGWEAWYCGLGAGYHKTHATRGSTADEALLKNRINNEIFCKRWGYWDKFKAANPYTPEYFTNGDVKFLCNADEMPLRISQKKGLVNGTSEAK